MKKIITLFLILFLGANAVSASSTDTDKNEYYQKKINEIGFNLLNSSNITSRMTFNIKTGKAKVTPSFVHKKIYVYSGIMPLLESDDEIAAMLSREIAYVQNSSKGIFRRTSMGYSYLKYEKKSERRAVDYMVNAGYNPVALIIVVNKRAGEPNWFEQYVIAHGGKKRLVYTYDYIYDKYPMFLAENEYLKSPYYQNFLRNTLEERKNITNAQKEKIRQLIDKEKENDEENI